MEDLVSVIIPVYNVEDYLDECLVSVCEQTYQNIEIILVNDGSTDKSGQKCNEWAERESRIRVIHKENGGLSSARNAGLEICTGEYIVFVDSDDILCKELVRKLYSISVEYEAEIVICDAAHFYGDNKCEYTDSEFIRIFEPKDAVMEMWYQTSFLPSAWAKIYKKNIFNKQRFREKIIFEDIDIMHLLFIKANKIVYNNSKLYGYRHRENSITTQMFSKKDLEIMNICKKIREFAETRDQDVLNAAVAYGVVGALRVYLNVPMTEEFEDDVKNAQKVILRDGKKVLRNKKIRKKLKMALILFFYFNPFMKTLYKRVDRWK